MQLQDYTLQVQELIHDIQAVDWTISEIIAYVNSARNRAALDLGCVRQLFQNGTIIPGQEQYPIFNAVVGATILNGGSGYNDAAPPVVTISAPALPGTQATAVAISINGIINQIQMTNWGSGYQSVPTVAIAPPVSGSTATASALCTVNVYDTNSISLLNGNLRYTLSWLPFTAFQAFCRAYTTQLRAPAVWSNFDGINTNFLFPIPDQSYPIDIDACLLPMPLVAPTDVDTQVLLPQADVVQYYAAYKALLKLQNFEQAEYFRKIYENRKMEMINTRQGRRVQSVYRNYYRRMARL